MDPTGTSSTFILDRGSVTMTGTGFDITWNVNTTGTVGHYLAIWGSDITNVKVADFTVGSVNSNQPKSYTGVGFQPTFGFVLIHTQQVRHGLLKTGQNGGIFNIWAQGGNDVSRNWHVANVNQSGVFPPTSYTLAKPVRVNSTIDPDGQDEDASVSSKHGKRMDLESDILTFYPGAITIDSLDCLSKVEDGMPE